MAKVIIGCKLPNGLVLEHPVDPSKKVALNGKNKALIIGADHATTEVDGEFWETWKMAHGTFKPLVSGAIFEARTVADVTAKARELEKEKTGMEPMPKKVKGIKKLDAE